MERKVYNKHDFCIQQTSEMNLKSFLLILTTISLSFSHKADPQQQLLNFVDGCRKQLNQWVGFKESTSQLLHKCNFNPQAQKILTLYHQWTYIGLDFTHQHFDLLRNYLKQDTLLKDSLKCIVDARNTQNEYFNEQKKFKYFGRFIKLHPSQGKSLFVQQQHMWLQKGKKLCNYFKAFFEYYYLYVLRPSQTASTTFLRALTVRSTIFDHQDIAYCVQVQTHGTIAENLQGLDINNIYVKIPQIINAIRFIKFKKHCQDQKSISMMKRIQERLKSIDMFKIMYHDYEPFVQIAAEKFGTTQIKLLASKVAHILENPQQYAQYKDIQL